MLCSACHIHVRRDFPYCLRCGTLRKGASVAAFDAPILAWGPERFAVQAETVTIGREAGNDVVIDHPSISRRHARITRTKQGFLLEDLGSSNGTALRPLSRPEQELAPNTPVVLPDGATVFIGDVEALFEQPRSTKIGSRTKLGSDQPGAAGTMLGVAAGSAPSIEAPQATEPLDARPRRRSGWALKEIPGRRGSWVLRSTATNQYLTLDERDVFLWERLDGENTMRDLLFAYFEQYGELALPRIESTVRSFSDAGLVRGLKDDAEELSAWRRFGKWLVAHLIKIELSIKNIDPLMERLYHGGMWRFFSPFAVFLTWFVTIAGLAAFVYGSRETQLFDFGGAGIVGLVVTTAAYVVATAIHEAAHALAVKSYGRRVNRGGFLLMMGMPFAFVDTSDMWFGTSYSRIVVAISGPLTTLGLAGVASGVAVASPNPTVSGVAYTLAAGLYLNTLFNLIPLVPLDGYQALADALRTPRLKEEASAYFPRGLISDVKARRRPGPKQVGLLIFGVLAFVCLWAMLGMSILMWESRLGDFARQYVPQPWLTVVVVGGLLLILFPAWFPRVQKLVRRMKARRAKKAEPAESAAPAAPAPVGSETRGVPTPDAAPARPDPAPTAPPATAPPATLPPPPPPTPARGTPAAAMAPGHPGGPSGPPSGPPRGRPPRRPAPPPMPTGPQPRIDARPPTGPQPRVGAPPPTQPPAPAPAPTQPPAPAVAATFLPRRDAAPPPPPPPRSTPPEPEPELPDPPAETPEAGTSKPRPTDSTYLPGRTDDRPPARPKATDFTYLPRR
ncbi:FHA domain-containing protein [Actinomycetospora aeridis]|uniref:FHA domain-containing protein n=1 Tax=Actinomycetospora aeridis TaxID=3129231 RepID=A0ABU8NG44_9PSEU